MAETKNTMTSTVSPNPILHSEIFCLHRISCEQARCWRAHIRNGGTIARTSRMYNGPITSRLQLEWAKGQWSAHWQVIAACAPRFVLFVTRFKDSWVTGDFDAQLLSVTRAITMAIRPFSSLERSLSDKLFPSPSRTRRKRRFDRRLLAWSLPSHLPFSSKRWSAVSLSVVLWLSSAKTVAPKNTLRIILSQSTLPNEICAS